METRTNKRIAKVRLTLTKRSVESLEPTAKPWIAWDDRLSGFGIRVQPSGTKSFLVNYRANGGGRHAPNKRVVIGRFGRMTSDQARRRAQALLGSVAAGGDPAAERAKARGLPTLAEAFEEYLAANPNRAVNTVNLYRQNLRVNLSDWVNRPPECHHQAGGGGAFQSHHRKTRLGRGEPDALDVAFDLSPPLCRSRRIEKSGRALVGRGRAISP